MINFAATPWNDTRARRWSGRLIAGFFAFVMLISMFAVFASMKAHADESAGTECKSIVFLGDSNGSGDKTAGVEEKLKGKGVDKVDFIIGKGKSSSELAGMLKDKNLDDTCVVVEGGTRDVKDSTSKNQEGIDKVLDATKSAKHVFWVTPTVSSTKASSDWKTTEFNRILVDTAKDNDNLSVINIQDMADDESNFKDNGVTMSDDGYKQRSVAIANAIDKHNGDVNSKDDDKSSSSAQPPADNNDGAGDGAGAGAGDSGAGAGAGAGDSGAGAGGGSGGGQGAGDIDERCEKENCAQGDTSKTSPKSQAERLSKVNSVSEATHYLPISRWGNAPVPVTSYDATDPSSWISTALGNMANFLTQGTTMLTSKLMIFIVNFAFSTNVASVCLTISDWTFGNIVHRDGNRGSTEVMISSVITITFIFSIIRAMSVKAGGIKDRVVGFLFSMAKIFIVLALFFFIGNASAKNSEKPSGTSVISNIDNTQTGLDGQIEYNSDGNMSPVADSGSDQPKGGNKSISNPETWAGGSLGWIVSMVYHYAMVFANAITNIILALLTTPLDMVSNAARDATMGNASTDMNGNRPACERYIDALHLAFENTRAMSDTPATARVFSSLDYMVGSFFFTSYAYIYGGNTISSADSWCMTLEDNSSINAGEWMMLNRTIGNYQEAIGSGNLIGNYGANAWTSGDHSNLSAEANIKRDGIGATHGYLVDADGNWNNGADNPQVWNAPARADNLMGRTNDDARNETQYWMAACTWSPKSGVTKIKPEWSRIRAMGTTGGTEDKDAKDISDKGDVDDRTRDAIGKLPDGPMKQRGSAALDKKEEKTGEGAKHNAYLRDIDCWDPANYPIGALSEATANSEESDDSSDDDDIQLGFGKSNESQRWNYAPLSPSIIGKIKDKVKSSSTVGRIAVGIWNKVSGDDDKSDDDPNNKFAGALTEEGFAPSRTFWNHLNGTRGMDNFQIAILVIILAFLMSVFVFLACLPALVINFVVGLMFLFIGVWALIIMISYVFKTATVRK